MPALNVQPWDVNLTNYYHAVVLALQWCSATAWLCRTLENTSAVIHRGALLPHVYYTMLVYKWNAVYHLCLSSCVHCQCRWRWPSLYTYNECRPKRSLLLPQVMGYSYYFLITTAVPCLPVPILHLHYTIPVTRTELLLRAHTPVSII